MNFDAFIKSLGIKPEERYCYKEVAYIMDKTDRTIERWCNEGINKRNQRTTTKVLLEKFNDGRTIVILGSDLIDFLRAIQAEDR
jgi:hypothetical protein